MDPNVVDPNRPVAVSDSVFSPSIYHVSCILAQSPRPRVPIPLLCLNDSEIDNRYLSSRHSGLKDPLLALFEGSTFPKALPVNSGPEGQLFEVFKRSTSRTSSFRPLERSTSCLEAQSFNSCERSTSGVQSHSLAPFERPTSSSSIPNSPDFVRPVSFVYNDLPYDWIFEAVNHHGLSVRFAGRTDLLFMPHRDESLEFLDRPSSSNLPSFKPLLYWEQPLSSLFCEDRPVDGDDHLTEINFADPLKPYPILHHELAAAVSSNHHLIQRLISLNPPDPDRRIKIAGYAHSFSHTSGSFMG